MPRTPKDAARSGGANAEPSASDSLQAALQAARGELMRAQRDLEAARLELVEQKRRASQHALVHSEELKEARRERDQMRMQLDALRMEMASPKKRRREEPRGVKVKFVFI